MTKEIDDGGPAFPMTGSNNDNGLWVGAEHGMSLRVYIATEALKSILVTHPVDPGDNTTDIMLDRCTKMVYRVADSMLRASKK